MRAGTCERPCKKMTILEAWAHVRLRVLDGCIRARWRGSKRRTYLRRYEAVAFLDAELDFDADSLPSMWECRECGIRARHQVWYEVCDGVPFKACVKCGREVQLLLSMSLDEVSVDNLSRLDAWRECRFLIMRFAAYFGTPLSRLAERNCQMREAVEVLDEVFGFDTKTHPYQCRYHGRLTRRQVFYRRFRKTVDGRLFSGCLRVRQTLPLHLSRSAS